MDDKEQRRQLAQQGVSALNWSVVNGLLTLSGGVLGFVVGWWVLSSTDFSLRLFAPFVGIPIGAYLGQRLMLALWSH